MSHRIRETRTLLEAVDDAVAQIRTLFETATNTNWKHDHVGVLQGALAVLGSIRQRPSEKTLRRDLGRLVTDNDGIDFPSELQSLLLQISTANLRDS